MGSIPPIPKAEPTIFRLIKLLVWKPKKCPSQVELTGLRLRPRKERTITMKAKTYLINCNCPQRIGTVKTLIVQMRNIWKKYKNFMQG